MSLRGAPYVSPKLAGPATGKTYPPCPSAGVTFKGRCSLCFRRLCTVGRRMPLSTVPYRTGTGAGAVVAGRAVVTGSVAVVTGAVVTVWVVVVSVVVVL